MSSKKYIQSASYIREKVKKAEIALSRHLMSKLKIKKESIIF
jgi:hypothetical protein